MKKIIRRISIVVLILVVAGVAAGVRYFTYDPDNKDEDLYGYVTDNEGMTYTMVADKQGTTYVVVTDAEGNRYAAEYDGTTVGSTVGGVNGEVSLEDVPTNFTGTHVDVSNDIDKFQGDVATTLPTLPQQEDTTATTQKNPDSGSQNGEVTTTKPSVKPDEQGNELKAYRIDKYQQIFKSGTYLMKMTTNDESMGDTPVTMAIKNGNMYVQMAMEMEGTSINCSMIYLKGKDTMYLIFDDWKKYCKMPKDMMGDMNMDEMMNEMGSEDIGKITVSEVEINGEKLILESYVSSDGTTVNYYFQNDVLVRRDNVFSDGHVDSSYFALLTTDVPDSYFEIPKGYGYINLSFLEGLV